MIIIQLTQDITLLNSEGDTINWPAGTRMLSYGKVGEHYATMWGRVHTSVAVYVRGFVPAHESAGGSARGQAVADEQENNNA